MTVPEQKKVIILVTIRQEVSVPADWDDDMIEFFHNESSSRANNVVDTIAADLDKCNAENKEHPRGLSHCFCIRTSAKIDPDQSPYWND